MNFQHHNLLNIFHINPSEFFERPELDFQEIYSAQDLRLIHDNLFDLNSSLIIVPV